MFKGIHLSTPEDALPWVGLYVSLASLVCILAMTVDVFQGFRQWKLWFPCNFFSLNAVSITLIAIATKLPVDLTTDSSNSDYDIEIVKIVSIFFLATMLANLLPSLGLMDDKELLVNMVALGILMITITVNVIIQMVTDVLLGGIFLMFVLVFSILCVLSVALSVPASRRVLEHQYKDLHLYRLASTREKIDQFQYQFLVHKVKKYWMMAETGNPQFSIACSQVSGAFGVIRMMFLALSVYRLQKFIRLHYLGSNSDYRWSISIIFYVQLIGIIVGSIAQMFRCLTSISNFNFSKQLSKKNLNVFKVEKHWIQQLRLWKRSYVGSNISGRHNKMIFHFFKNTVLNFCIALQVMFVVLCKTICLIPRFILILFSCCWYNCKTLLKRFKGESNASSINLRLSEMKKYKDYVLEIEDHAIPSERVLKNTLNSITRLLRDYEENKPRNLMTLLEKSSGFNGVVKFDDEQVPHLTSEETHNSWSLAVITLTAIAVALPNVANDHTKWLLVSVNEGLQLVQHVEETLHANDELVKARKASKRVATEIEVYRTWLQIDLRKRARKGKPSKEILQWLSNESVQMVRRSKKQTNASLDQSLHKLITVASSMYRISQTILIRFNKQENWPKDEEVYEWVLEIIADILYACFTNLPRVVNMKCHHDAIEKRQDSIRTAAQILGRSKMILDILKDRQLPNLDLDSMAYLDKWRALPKSQIPKRCASTSSIDSITVAIM